jgi:hypothetical protein
VTGPRQLLLEVVELGDEVVDALRDVPAPLVLLQRLLFELADLAGAALALLSETCILPHDRLVSREQRLHGALEPIELGVALGLGAVAVACDPGNGGTS